MQIREMTENDLPSVSALSEQLGYPVKIEDLVSRFERLRGSKANRLWVAVDQSGNILGWAHAGVREALTYNRACEVIGIVVDSSLRRKGVGRRLMEVAESWAAEERLEHIRIRSQALRESAHEFYKSLGYDLLKIQNVFIKQRLG